MKLRVWVGVQSKFSLVCGVCGEGGFVGSWGIWWRRRRWVRRRRVEKEVVLNFESGEGQIGWRGGLRRG